MSRRYWSKNMQTSPHMSYNGLSEPTPQSPLPAEDQPQSSHVPLSFILAERGTDRPVFTTSANAWTLFGKKTFLKNVPWNIHQNDYLTHVLKSGGQAIVKRIILPDAKKARIRVALETSFTLIPIYKYHEDWSLVKQYNTLTGQWDNVELGQRKGLKVTPRIYAIPYSENQSFGQGTVIAEQSSRTYPIFDLELRDSGEFGNGITMTLANVIRDLTDVTDPRDFIARASIAFNENVTDIILNKQGEATTSFTLSGNVIDPLTAVKQHLSSAVNNFDGLIGRAHVYQSNIEEVLDKLIHGSEIDPTYLGEKALIEEAILLNTDVDLTYPHAADLDVDLNRYYFNILTGKNNKGKFFINGDYPSLEQSSDLEFTEGEAVSFLGGSDGFPLDSNGEVDRLKLLQLYDEAVRIELNKFTNPGHMYQDLAKNPYTVWYDSGYSMPTKTAAFNINRYRPEITLILAAFSYADYNESGLTISCEGATSGTGCIEFSGTWNIEIDNEEVATGLTAAQIKDYLNGTGEFNVFECVDEVPVEPEPDPTPISCDGAKPLAQVQMKTIDNYSSDTALVFTINVGGVSEEIPLNPLFDINGDIYRIEINDVLFIFTTMVVGDVDYYALDIYIEQLAEIEKRISINFVNIGSAIGNDLYLSYFDENHETHNPTFQYDPTTKTGTLCLAAKAEEPEPDPTPIGCEGAIDTLNVSGQGAELTLKFSIDDVYVGRIDGGLNIQMLNDILQSHGLRYIDGLGFKNDSDQYVRLKLEAVGIDENDVIYGYFNFWTILDLSNPTIISQQQQGEDSLNLIDSPPLAYNENTNSPMYSVISACLAPSTGEEDDEPVPQPWGLDRLSFNYEFGAEDYRDDVEWVTEDFEIKMNGDIVTSFPSEIQVFQAASSMKFQGVTYVSGINVSIRNYSSRLINITLTPKTARGLTYRLPAYPDPLNEVTKNDLTGVISFKLYPWDGRHYVFGSLSINIEKLGYGPGIDYCSLDSFGIYCDPINYPRPEAWIVDDVRIGYSINDGQMQTYVTSINLWVDGRYKFWENFFTHLLSLPELSRDGKSAFKLTQNAGNIDFVGFYDNDTHEYNPSELTKLRLYYLGGIVNSYGVSLSPFDLIYMRNIWDVLDVYSFGFQ